MVFNKNLTLRFSEDLLESFIVSKTLRSFRIKPLGIIKDFYEKEEETLKLLKKIRFNNTKTDIILAFEDIITTVVEVPVISYKELELYIKEHIQELFTVNVKDYYYDYKIVSKDTGKYSKYTLLVAIFSKKKLTDIIAFCERVNLKINTMTIYPEVLGQLLFKEGEKSIAFFDIKANGYFLTIYDKKNLFLYTKNNGFIEVNSEEELEEIFSEFNYFLNFYSTRHYGNTIDMVYFLGDKDLTSYFSKKYDGNFKEDFIFKGKNFETFPDILGNLLRSNKVRGRKKLHYINFLEAIEKENKKEKEDKIGKVIIIAIILIDLLCLGSFKYYVSRYASKYNPANLNSELASLISVEKEINALKNEIEGYRNKSNLILKLQKDSFNYNYYIDLLNSIIPNHIKITRLYINKDYIEGYFALANGALDKLKLIEDINKTGIFERLDVDSIKLDNSETSARLIFKPKVQR